MKINCLEKIYVNHLCSNINYHIKKKNKATICSDLFTTSYTQFLKTQKQRFFINSRYAMLKEQKRSLSKKTFHKDDSYSQPTLRSVVSAVTL